MNDFFGRFDEMVADIKSRPYLEVVEYKVLPPVSGDSLKAVEESLKASLAEPIRDFYSHANGLNLRWRIKKDLPEEEVQKIIETSDDYTINYPENDQNPFAVINILPMEKSLLRKTWKPLEVDIGVEQVEFGGKPYSFKDFKGRLKPLDLFSDYDCMAYFLEEGNGDPKVLHLSDYYIEWDNSRITNFESYLEMLLVTRGIVEARDTLYSESGGDTKPVLLTPESYWKNKHIPKLFRAKK